MKTTPTQPAAATQDVIVVFGAPDAAVRTSDATFAQIEAMPLGRERKVAAFDAVRGLGIATLDANRDVIDALDGANGAKPVDELWSLGAVRVRGTSLAEVRRIAGPRASAVLLDQRVDLPRPPVELDAVDGAAQLRPATPTDPAKVWMDWGVDRMKAPSAWAQGITGAGVVIGSLDTGVAVQHEVLRRNYRGSNADGTRTDDYNWKDVVKELPEDGTLPDGSKLDPADAAANGTSKRPIDLNGHGTHTSGSAVGWSPNAITGVAPDAKLIVARGLGEKGGSMFDLVSAMEWFMAPTKVDGSAPRPDLAPDVVTNSWGGAPVSNLFLWSALRNWRRAGIIPVFASGNDRNAQPGAVAVPGMYPETITVGANDLDGGRAWFSMYGPSKFANGPKPDVMAPGHWTYSSLPDGTVRDTFPVHMPDGTVREAPASGTSMATPHVAGAVALYLQAHPGATYDEVLDALKRAGSLAAKPTQDQGYGMVQVDRLVTKDTIAPDAVRTDATRVAELAEQVRQAKVFNEGVRKPGIPR